MRAQSGEPGEWFNVACSATAGDGMECRSSRDAARLCGVAHLRLARGCRLRYWETSFRFGDPARIKVDLDTMRIVMHSLLDQISFIKNALPSSLLYLLLC